MVMSFWKWYLSKIFEMFKDKIILSFIIITAIFGLLALIIHPLAIVWYIPSLITWAAYVFYTLEEKEK